MAPAPIDPAIRDVIVPRKDTLGLPEATRARLTKAGIDLSEGYPYRPSAPLYLDDVHNIRNNDRPHVDPGSRADRSKKNLLDAASKVEDLTSHIGTVIEGIQLKDLTAEQKDELGLLIAERSVVFFRDQDISPQQQKELGEWYGEIEIHVSFSRSIDVSYSLTLPSLKCPKYRVFQASLSSGPHCRQPRDQPTSGILEEHLVGIRTSSTSVSRQE